MSKKKDIKEIKNNNFLSISRENKIIEEIMKNPILLNEIEEMDDYEEETDNYSETDNITQEILGNKLSFILLDDKISQTNLITLNNVFKKIYKDIIDNLFIELYTYHYDSKTLEKKNYLTSKIIEANYQIENICTKLNDKFSKYILLIIDQKICELIEFINEGIKNKQVSFREVIKIKKCLGLTGQDIMKIFEIPFKKTKHFDISSVLIIMFIHNILDDDEITNFTDLEYEEIANIPSIEEKDFFDKYIEDCKKNLIRKYDHKEEQKKEKVNIREENKIVNKCNEEKNKEEEIKNIENYDNDELINYINENSDTKKRKKKKRKKKTKDKLEEKEIKIIEEDDVIISNFKQNLIKSSDEFINMQKIKPNISDAFIERLKLMC